MILPVRRVRRRRQLTEKNICVGVMSGMHNIGT